MKLDYSKTINEQLEVFDYYKNNYLSYQLEIERLNNIINELEKYLNETMESYGYEMDITDRIEKITIKNILRKLKELKGE